MRSKYLIVLLLAFTTTGCFFPIQTIRKNNIKQFQKDYFARQVAHKVTETLKAIIADTLARSDTFRFTGYAPEPIQLLMHEQKAFMKIERFALRHGLYLVGNASCDYGILFTYVESKIREAKQLKKHGEEILQILNESLELLQAYYQTNTNSRHQKGWGFVIPVRDKFSRKHLSDLDIIYLQTKDVKASGRQNEHFIFQLGWDMQQFENFVTGLLMGEFKLKPLLRKD